MPVACEIVQALQTFVTRSLDVFDPGVITVGRITAGTTFNVIPETAELLRHHAGRLGEDPGQAARRHAAGGRGRVRGPRHRRARSRWSTATPSPSTTATSPRFAHDVAADLLGPQSVVKMPNPVMGSEDFSYVLQRVPGAMAFLGAAPRELSAWPRRAEPLEPVTFDEDVMATGTALYAAVALEHLADRVS